MCGRHRPTMHVTRRARHVWLPTLAHHPSGSPMLHPSPAQRRCVQRGCRSAGCMHRQIPRTAVHQQLPHPPLRVGALTHDHARRTTRTFTRTSTRARHTSANRGAETAHLVGRQADAAHGQRRTLGTPLWAPVCPLQITKRVWGRWIAAGHGLHHTRTSARRCTVARLLLTCPETGN